VIAEAARRMNVLTVGVVTKPFLFEGSRRMRAAEAGIAELQKHVDTLIVIPNQNLFLIAKPETTFKEAFQLADEVLQQGVRSITDLMVMPGLINLDFADVRSVMSEMGKAMMGTGEAEGENRALRAAEQAIANPLLDGVSMAGAKGVIISIIGGEDMRLLEVDEAANHIRELVDEDANIIWGSAFNPELAGKIRVSVVATGIDQGAVGALERPQPTSLGIARAPKRPVLELSEDDGLAGPPAKDDAAPLRAAAGSIAAAGFTLTSPEALAAADEASEEEGYGIAAPLDLTGMQADDELDEEYAEDVDEIVDPLAGLRGVDDDIAGAGEGDGGLLDLTGQHAASGDDGGRAASPPPVQDDLLASADRLVAQDQPVTARPGGRRRPVLGGSTLFERMANLSRSTGHDEDEDEEGEDSPAISIPRFLDRNRNQ
jgi:cell division protein FtsZ